MVNWNFLKYYTPMLSLNWERSTLRFLTLNSVHWNIAIFSINLWIINGPIVALLHFICTIILHKFPICNALQFFLTVVILCFLFKKIQQQKYSHFVKNRSFNSYLNFTLVSHTSYSAHILKIKIYNQKVITNY